MSLVSATIDSSFDSVLDGLSSELLIIISQYRHRIRCDPCQKLCTTLYSNLTLTACRFVLIKLNHCPILCADVAFDGLAAADWAFENEDDSNISVNY
jgi:hypothetical protein